MIDGAQCQLPRVIPRSVPHSDPYHPPIYTTSRSVTPSGPSRFPIGNSAKVRFTPARTAQCLVSRSEFLFSGTQVLGVNKSHPLPP